MTHVPERTGFNFEIKSALCVMQLYPCGYWASCCSEKGGGEGGGSKSSNSHTGGTIAWSWGWGWSWSIAWWSVWSIYCWNGVGDSSPGASGGVEYSALSDFHTGSVIGTSLHNLALTIILEVLNAECSTSASDSLRMVCGNLSALTIV